jgi:hypothetical protein
MKTALGKSSEVRGSGNIHTSKVPAPPPAAAPPPPAAAAAAAAVAPAAALDINPNSCVRINMTSHAGNGNKTQAHVTCNGKCAYNYPSTPAQWARYRVFCDLHDRGLFVTEGSKFGGDFLV